MAVDLCEESRAASDRAARLDAASDRSAARFGPPMADKDLHLRAGVPTTFGSRAFAGYVPEETDALTTQSTVPVSSRSGRPLRLNSGSPATPRRSHGHTTIPGHPELGAAAPAGQSAAVAAGLLPFAPGATLAARCASQPRRAASWGSARPGADSRTWRAGKHRAVGVGRCAGRTGGNVALMVDGMIPARARQH